MIILGPSSLPPGISDKCFRVAPLYNCVASIVCYSERSGVIAFCLLSKRNHSSHLVPLIAQRRANSSPTNISNDLYIKHCIKKERKTSEDLSVGLCERQGKSAGRRWQVASCHYSWRDGCCDILNLNNLRPNNTSPHARVKCGSWLHVSLMPPPPNPFHNSAGTGEAATCRGAA